MTYEAFFELEDAPFRLTPDPDYYFSSPVHSEALQNLLYSIRAGEGFAQITGDPGTGKTVTIHTLLTRLGEDVKTALILHPRLSLRGLLKSILLDFGVDAELIEENRSKESLLRLFREEMLRFAEQGISPVIIVDEAQNLPPSTLEELRLLSNLETAKKKLLQIILVGQRELETLLERPGMRQIHQRITIRYRLVPFTSDDTGAYIRHRLKIAGSDDTGRFSGKTLKRIHKLSKGLPRLINIICERAMMAAYVAGEVRIGNTHLKKAVNSITGETGMRGNNQRLRTATVVPFLALLILIGTLGVSKRSHLTEAGRSLFNTATVYFSPGAPSDSGGLPRPRNETSPLAEEETPPSPPIATKTERPSNKPVSKPAPDDGSPHGKPLQFTAAPAPGKSPDPDKTGRPLEETVAALPGMVVNLPEKALILTINRKKESGRLWEGGSVKPILKKEFPVVWAPAEGVFLLIREKNGRELVFSNTLPFVRGEGDKGASELWKAVEGYSPGKALPMLVHDGERALTEQSKEKAGLIRETLKNWAGAWGGMDLDAYMTFYGDYLMIYRPFEGRKPSVYTKAELRGRTSKIFAGTRSISLTISDPVCIADPTNSSSGVAYFNQQYASNRYSDRGVKTLFMNHGDTLSESTGWKITGRLWFPR